MEPLLQLVFPSLVSPETTKPCATGDELHREGQESHVMVNGSPTPPSSSTANKPGLLKEVTVILLKMRDPMLRG